VAATQSSVTQSSGARGLEGGGARGREVEKDLGLRSKDPNGILQES
jgi:hypothetical protein